MPTVIPYNDPRIMASYELDLINSMAQNRARYDQTQLQRDRFESQEDLEWERFNAEQRQRDAQNQIDRDRNAIYAENNRLDAQAAAARQAGTLAQRDVQNSMAERRQDWTEGAPERKQEGTEAERQAKIQRNLQTLEEVRKSGLSDDNYKKARLRVENGEDTYKALHALRQEQDKAQQDQAKATKDAVEMAEKREEAAKADLKDYLTRNSRKMGSMTRFTGDPAERDRLERIVQAAREAVVQASRGQARPATQPAQQGQAAQQLPPPDRMAGQVPVYLDQAKIDQIPAGKQFVTIIDGRLALVVKE
jgi:hypothetical protein